MHYSESTSAKYVLIIPFILYFSSFFFRFKTDTLLCIDVDYEYLLTFTFMFFVCIRRVFWKWQNTFLQNWKQKSKISHFYLNRILRKKYLTNFYTRLKSMTMSQMKLFLRFYKICFNLTPLFCQQVFKNGDKILWIVPRAGSRSGSGTSSESGSISSEVSSGTEDDFVLSACSRSTNERKKS